MALPLGCGYTIAGRSGSLGEIQRVSIETFTNESGEPGFELELTEAFLEEFYRRGSVKLVEDPATADLVLSGRVLPVETTGTSYSSTAFALEYGIIVTLEIEATLADGERLPLGTNRLQARDRYLASADIEIARRNKREALRSLSSTLATRAHDALLEYYHQ